VRAALLNVGGIEAAKTAGEYFKERMMRKIWKAMMLIPLIALCANASGQAASNSQGNCVLNQYASLDVIVTQDNQILLPASINGQDVYLTLQLGSALSSVSRVAADQTGMTIRKFEPYGNGASTGSNIRQTGDASPGIRRSDGVSLDSLAKADTLSFGAVKFRDVEFLTSEKLTEELVLGPAGKSFVAGFVGMSLFANLDLEVNLARGKINLFAPNTCKGAAVYWASEYTTLPLRRTAIGQPYFVVELDGKKLGAQFATGSNESVIFTDVSKKLYGWDASSPGIETQTLSDGREKSKYKAMAITANGLSIMNANVTLNEPDKCRARAGIGFDRDKAATYGDQCFNVMPFYIGMSLLKKMHIYISSKEGLMYLTTADARL
jgi:hypothetical protein